MDDVEAEIVMGEEAARFMDSPIGRYVMGCAEQEIKLASRELIDADIKDEKAMRAIQLRMALGAKFEDWIVDLINRGAEARVAREQGKQE